jgi:hypothetical protein
VIDFSPPVPYTPPVFSAVPEQQRVRFWYRTSGDGWTAFREHADRIGEGCRRYELRIKRDEAVSELAALENAPDSPPTHRARARLRQTLEDAERALARPGAPELGPAEQYDEFAALLSRAVVWVEAGDVRRSWPTDHAEAVKIVRALSPQALLQIVEGIRSQLYDEALAGKP